ncbi:MAG: hypothetical protein IJH12_04495 [Clostridia bacterium]|nr:hypothetical protein [Clostridia bacterium]
MRILDFFKDLIHRSKAPKLGENNIDLDRTMRIVTINEVEEIINNPETYKKFMNYKEFQSLFGDGVEQIDYIQGIKAYAKFMDENGVKFSSKQRRRIKNILKLDYYPEEPKQKLKKSSDKGSKKELYNIARSIITDESTFIEYLNAKDSFANVPLDVLNNYICNQLDKLFHRVRFSPEDESRRICIINKIREKSSLTRLDAKIQINPKFEELIMKNIDPNLKGIELAYAIYNELNKNVKYSSAFFALNQDLDNEFAKSIYYKDPDDVSKENNSVACKTWSELYGYFLEKIGMEVYIAEDGKHRYVVAYHEGNKIKADATNQTHSNDDNSRLTDLVRARLGARPAGFEVFDYKDTKVEIKKELGVLKSDYSGNDYLVYQDKSKLDELIELIDNKENLTDSFFGLEENTDSLKSIAIKLNYINDIMKNAKLDNIESLGYLNHLFYNILSYEEQKRASVDVALYENLYKDCNVVPVISIYRGQFLEDGKKAGNDYAFLRFDQNTHQFIKTTKEELLAQIKDGALSRIKIDEKYKEIEGIPEIVMNEDPPSKVHLGESQTFNDVAQDLSKTQNDDESR